MSDELEEMQTPIEDQLGPTLGAIESHAGIDMKVVGVETTFGGWQKLRLSAEPLARKRGYRTRDEVLGARIEHLPPDYIPRGTRRDAAKLTEKDWDFRPLLKNRLATRALALFHELSRESARMREACGVYEAGLENTKHWDAKKDDALARMYAAEDLADNLNDKLEAMQTMLAKMESPTDEQIKKLEELRAERDAAFQAFGATQTAHSFVSVVSGNGRERIDWEQADRFLRWRMERFPHRIAALETAWIAQDKPWLDVDRSAIARFLWQARRRGKEKGVLRKGLRAHDVSTQGPSWPFDNPLEIATEWRTDPESSFQGRPCFALNSGIPGLPEVAAQGNGKDAELIVSESLDVCVCFNFRDEDIVSAFEQWLKERRASLPDDLKDFRISDERPQTRLKSKDVNAALIGLAALRLRARFGPKEAAYKLQEIYFPAEQASIGATQRRALVAVRWQRDFFRYCPLDSEEVSEPQLGTWDHECPLCFHVWELPRESNWIYETHRCPCCDHREQMRWAPSGWVALEDE